MKVYFSKTYNQLATLEKEDHSFIFLQLEDGRKVRENKFKFKHFYTEVDPLVNDLATKPEKKPKIIESVKADTRIPSCDGIKPVELYTEFKRILDSFGVEYDSEYNEKTNTLVIRWNGYNIFKISYNRLRFWVLAHPNSLTPTLRQSDTYWHTSKAYNEKKKKGVGETLRSKFIFTKWDQRNIMKTLIRSGFEYRRTMDTTPEDFREEIRKLKELKDEATD